MSAALTRCTPVGLWLWFNSADEMLAFDEKEHHVFPTCMLFNQTNDHTVRATISKCEEKSRETGIPVHSVWITDEVGYKEPGGFFPTFLVRPVDFDKNATLMFDIMAKIQRKIIYFSPVTPPVAPRGK